MAGFPHQNPWLAWLSSAQTFFVTPTPNSHLSFTSQFQWETKIQGPLLEESTQMPVD
jgi:hypothetical protein